MQSQFFVDLHCHPSIKAFARSFKKSPGVQGASSTDSTSIWHRDAPSLFDKIKNYTVGLTNFIQSDASSLLKGRVCVVCLSFYPQEKSFFVNKAGKGIVSDILLKLATEFGQARIDHVQAMKSYWEDLKMEMQFVMQQAGKEIKIEGHKVVYKVAGSFADIATEDSAGTLGDTTVYFIPTIEGGHVFDQVMNSYEPWDKFPGGVPADKLATTLGRIRELREGKNGLLRPAFITIAHHFWNGLCGQARSLGGIVKSFVDQENGISGEKQIGLTNSGKDVIRGLLRNEADSAGQQLPRIYPDIKHMSRQGRLDYFELLDKEFGTENIPLIASHAGVTGLSAPGGKNQTAASQEGLYMTDDINFYDDEILRICRSNGVFGIQLDERRIGSEQAKRHARGHIGRRNILYAWGKLVWNQIRHIAELLDKNGEFAWGIQCIGSDFDGIIDPINGYWTSSQLDQLDGYLLKHAFNYLSNADHPTSLTQARNKNITAEEIVDRVMTGNAMGLLRRIY